MLGADPRAAGPALRRRIGYLPGELRLDDRLRVDETLRSWADAAGRTSTRPTSDALCERLDLDPTRRRAGLSSGNRRKVGLVGAFMARPELLVLDEPTAGVDPLVQAEFLELVDEARDDGQTVFLSSHVLSEVQRVAGRGDRHPGRARWWPAAAIDELRQAAAPAVHGLVRRPRRRPSCGRSRASRDLDVRGDEVSGVDRGTAERRSSRSSPGTPSTTSSCPSPTSRRRSSATTRRRADERVTRAVTAELVRRGVARAAPLRRVVGRRDRRRSPSSTPRSGRASRAARRCTSFEDMGELLEAFGAQNIATPAGLPRRSDVRPDAAAAAVRAWRSPASRRSPRATRTPAGSSCSTPCR